MFARMQDGDCFARSRGLWDAILSRVVIILRPTFNGTIIAVGLPTDNKSLKTILATQ
jgi:hypothetical protein